MFMRTWDYNGFAVGPVLTLLERIFDSKMAIFFKKMIFWFVDKSSGSADNNEKMWGKVVYNLFEPESII